MSGKRYKRFYVSESENQLTIYDNEGLDDYYHLGNDERDVKGICKLLNEQQATINLLLDLLYQSEAIVISECSSHIGEDMDKLDKIFKEKDIKEIERFVRGCDDE